MKTQYIDRNSKKINVTHTTTNTKKIQDVFEYIILEYLKDKKIIK